MKNYQSIFSSLMMLFLKKTYCPVCQKHDQGFTPLPEFYKISAMKYGYSHFGKGEMTALDTYSCSNCGASDRERLYAWWLKHFYFRKIKRHTITAIHFAPESCLSNFLKEQDSIRNYQTADFMMDGVDYKIDLMNLPFSNEVYDFFICSHVLEHVSDDRKAIAELYRVTKRGGKGILMVPIITDLLHTIEDPSITDESERWRLFGQNDHVRIYSRNEYVERIIKAGFHLEQLGIEFFGSQLFKKIGLKPSSILYIVTKP